MVDYIQVGIHKKRLKWLPTEIDGTISLEVLQSAFPHSSGMCFKVNNECFVIRIQNGNFYPPAGGWQRYDYEPIFDIDEDDENEYDYDHENHEQSDDGEEYDYCDKDSEDDRYYDEYDDYDGRDGRYETGPEDFSEIIYQKAQNDKEREENDEWDNTEDDE